MGHVSGPKKYECVIWKVCVSLSRIGMDEGVVVGSRLGSG